MDKAMFIFEKLSKKKERDFLTEDVKNTVSGAAGGAVGTIGTMPLDNRTVNKQREAMKGFGKYKVKDLLGAKSGKEFKSLSTKLLKKNFGGLGVKLMKTVPAVALTFGTVGVTKKILDELDKKASKADMLKNIADYSQDAADAVKGYVIKNFDDVKDADKFIKKNVNRITVKQDGAVTDIQNRRIRNKFKVFNPRSRNINMKVDLDSGRTEISDRNKNILTRITKPADKPKGSKLKSTAKKLLAGGAIGAGGGAYGASKLQDNKKDGDYIKRKIRGM